MGFHLHAPRWFGWQMLPGYTGSRCVPYFSLIHLRRVTPLKTGKGLIEIAFWNPLYAEGVQDFQVRLKVLQRAENFLVGSVADDPDGDQVAILSHIEFGWLERFCPELLRVFPPVELGSLFSGSVSVYLDGVFFQDPPLPAQPEDLNDGSENGWLTACALRFDGYECAGKHGWEIGPYDFCQALLAGEWLDETLEAKLTAMFMLQRFLMKEGVRSKTDAGWRRFRELFLELAAEPVQPPYRMEPWHEEWETRFAPVVAGGLALIGHLHRTTVYDGETVG